MKNILATFLMFAVMGLSVDANAGETVRFKQPCALPVSMEILAGKAYAFDLMSCLQRPEGYSWNFFENQVVLSWMSLTSEGILTIEPGSQDRGRTSIMLVTTHGGSDFYFFPVEIEVK
ncbi:MAG: hypothetical protein ACAH59_13320 [Pseudobdellovibrionaceae bacterium]